MNEFEATTDKASLKKELRKNSTRNSLGLLIFLLVMNVVQIAVGAVIGPLEGTPFFESETFQGVWAPLINLGVYVLLYLIICPIAIMIVNKASGRKPKDVLAKPEVSTGFIVKWTFIGIAFTQTISIVINIITMILSAIGVELTPIPIESVPSALGAVTSILAFAFLAPIMEELLFRGGILQNAKKFGGWFAIAMSAVFFGLYHCNYTQLFYTCALGLACGFVSVKAKSIVPAVVIHFTLNLIGAITSIAMSFVPAEFINATAEMSMEEQMTLISENALPIMGMILMEMLVIGIIITGIVLFIVEMVKNKKALKLENECPELKTGEKLAAYFSSPMTIVLTVLLLGITVMNALGMGMVK